MVQQHARLVGVLTLFCGACGQAAGPGPGPDAATLDVARQFDALADRSPADRTAADGVKMDRDLRHADGGAPDLATLPAAPGVFPYTQCLTKDPAAKFLGEGSPPATLARGGKAKVWVVFANCSQQTWTAGAVSSTTAHKLGSQAPQDNTNWGFNRVALPGNVPPSQMVRVDFTITAPMLAASYDYRWQIVHEGTAWLEVPSPLHTVVVQDQPAKLADLWAGTAQFIKDQDPVPVNAPASGHREAFAVNRPDISPTTIYLYHRCFNQSAADASICLSISGDGGATFPQFLGEIVGPDPGHIFSVAPSVIQKNGIWYMVYEESNDAAIYWAQSSDGKSWAKKGQLLSKKTQTWDAGANATPGIFLDAGGTIYVFYAGFPVGGSHMSIGFASGTSMTALTKYPGNPVLAPPASGWSKGQISMPRVVEQDSYFYMIFEGADTDFTCAGYNRYGWGLARSTDLKMWTALPANPLGQASSGCGNDMPSLFIRYDTQVFAYHTSADTKRIVREHLVSN